MSYAIDFGTSNTVVARWNAATQQPETVSLGDLSFQLGESPALVPSLAYIENALQGQVLVGQQVRDRGLDLNTDRRFFCNFKRGIGAQIPGFLPELDGRVITFEQVGHWFLLQLVQQLQLNNSTVSQSVVFTVPVDSFEAYRHWLGTVCQDLQVEQIQMLDEPTAAALGYGVADQETLMVVDFGGGTLDLAVVQLALKELNTRPLGFILKWGEKQLAKNSAQQLKTARVLAKAGLTLGGSDIDNWLVDYFAVKGLEQTPLTTRLAERLKIQLSSQPQASEVYFNDETFESYELKLDREGFEAVLKEHQFFERLDDAMFQLLQQVRRQGLDAQSIDAVLLVGGTTQIPAVQTWIQQYFEPAKIKRDRPFEAIAQGALQLGQGFELKDFLYHGYGIRYWDRRQNAHNWHSLIPAGQSYPMAAPIELVLGASLENQPSIELIVGELGAQTAATEVYFDGDRLITCNLASAQAQVQPLNDREGARSIARLTPPGYPGRDRIKVLFWVDSQRFLRMTVEDLLTEDTLLENQIVTQLS